MKKTLVIQNLKCGGCEQTITNNLQKIYGVSALEIDHSNSSISFDCLNELTLVKVKKELDKLGYPDAESSNSIGKKAKSYISCAVGKLNTK